METENNFDREKQKEMRGKAQRCFDEIERRISLGTDNLTNWLVKATKNGMDPEVANNAFQVLHGQLEAAYENYKTAINQPDLTAKPSRFQLVESAQEEN